MATHPPMQDGILIDILRLKQWRPLSRTLDHYAHHLSDEDYYRVDQLFPRWLLGLYRARIRDAINFQRFPRQYAPLSPAYVAWKDREGLKPGFWRATGFLVDHLTYWHDPKQDCHHIGFRPRLLHPTSGELVWKIAQRLELGDAKQHLPARPLFIPIADQLRRNIRRHFLQYCTKRAPHLKALLDPQLLAEGSTSAPPQA